MGPSLTNHFLSIHLEEEEEPLVILPSSWRNARRPDLVQIAFGLSQLITV